MPLSKVEKASGKASSKASSNSILQSRLTEKHKAKYIKLHEKLSKKTCKIFKKNKKARDTCKKLADCGLKHCKNELYNLYASQITEEEREECAKKSGDDYKKKFDCVENKMKSLNLYEHTHKYGHCVANKCEEDQKKIILNLVDTFKDETPSMQCFKEKCSESYKKSEDIDKYNEELRAKCIKEHDNTKDYDKCLKKIKKSIFMFQDKCFKEKCNVTNSKTKSKSKK